MQRDPAHGVFVAAAVDSGTPLQLVGPFASRMATAGGNELHDMRFDFAKVRSTATSPWRQAPVSSPRYRDPLVAASVPPGGSITLEYRAADSATGVGVIPWSTSIAPCSFKPFLQYRVTFTGNGRTGLVPSIDAIVIPVD
jgi:hypothetical protein